MMQGARRTPALVRTSQKERPFSMPSFHRGRFVVGAAVAISTLALAGCGADGVMHRGSTALQYDGRTVTSQQLQTATDEINKATGYGIDPANVAQVLSIGPEIIKVGEKNGVVFSDSYLRNKYKKSTLSDVAVEALRVNDISQTLSNAGNLTKADTEKIAAQNATLNPRYGSWVKGTGPTTAPEPWISASPTSTGAAPNGHPAE
ncbi:outer membrane murein-binding lipoprotein Lpp [Flexivirga oryzae]|uniref:Outer membrane murein-binding lipoprotein Lpp n=2 Tax=Flexivirga oryzae TaxID=1794944 RepID=A0A839NJ20_9MICO|nr:outer membrane murein-binding lipoprotein Lpp [Flexivirga oryzae]